MMLRISLMSVVSLTASLQFRPLAYSNRRRSPFALRRGFSSSSSPSGRLPALRKGPMSCCSLRGGSSSRLEATACFGMGTSPSRLFDGLFLGLAVSAAVSKALTSRRPPLVEKEERKDPSLGELQRRFLPVFWLLRMADWLQGPYFYEVYSTKVFGGKPASLELVSKLFLAGFASTAIAGPSAGRLVDSYGRKLGTLCFAFLYSAAALATRSQALTILFAGRVISGIGTSLLFSAPEAWLVGEARRLKSSASSLSATFGAAFAGDALVAILAGHLASAAAASRGPCGPFELSVVFLVLGGLLATTTWKENYSSSERAPSGEDEETGSGEASKSSSSSGSGKRGPTIAEAARVALSDKRIVLVGLAQALFEGAMYVFVLQWPPALSLATSRAFPASPDVPFGKVFSCFMVCCLLGSTAFSAFVNKVATERSTLATFGLATVAMAAATVSTTTLSVSGAASSLAGLVAAFFAFELCVGLYFPSIGTLRSKYVPDSHRSVIMNLFGIPLNALVISVFLSIRRLGVSGALAVATASLGLATAAMAALDRTLRTDSEEAVASAT